MKLISVVTPCYNEEGNVRELAEKIREVFLKLPKYDYEHIFIDNCSTDGTQAILRDLAQKDKKIKVIFNLRNFGHIRSPYYALLQARGDAVLHMASDFQDPPALIPQFIEKWEAGALSVMGRKIQSEESPIMYWIRTLYYRLINRLSSIDLTKNTTGFGIYDRKVIDTLKTIDEPYPYFRGLISELGFTPALIDYHQPSRKRGITKNNFYTLYDIAMLGITNHSKIPLRIATMAGFLMSGVSLFIAFGYFVAKLVFWNTFVVGTAPVLIGLFFFSSVQLFFIGLIGEYIGSIQTQVLKRPLVIERERIGF